MRGHAPDGSQAFGVCSGKVFPAAFDRLVENHAMAASFQIADGAMQCRVVIDEAGWREDADRGALGQPAGEPTCFGHLLPSPHPVSIRSAGGPQASGFLVERYGKLAATTLHTRS